MIIMNQVDFGF